MLGKLGTLVVVASAITLALVTPASASQTQLSGEAVLIDEAALTFSMSGSLVGIWYTDSQVCHAIPGKNEETWPCTGTEHFVGCLDADGNGVCNEASGTLYLEFSFTGTPVGNGRCHHPIVGGDGAFTGATGQLTFKDRLGACGIVETTYKGHISLP